MIIKELTNLQKELEQKDLIIKELTNNARASDISNSKVLTHCSFLYNVLVLNQNAVSTHYLDNRGFLTWKTLSEGIT